MQKSLNKQVRRFLRKKNQNKDLKYFILVNN